VVPTTSPSRRTNSGTGLSPQSRPIKSIRLKITVTGAESADLGRLAAEKGLAVQAKGGSITIAITANAPEDALAQLALLGGIITSKSQKS
jgi:hypothetical protein